MNIEDNLTEVSDGNFKIKAQIASYEEMLKSIDGVGAELNMGFPPLHDVEEGQMLTINNYNFQV